MNEDNDRALVVPLGVFGAVAAGAAWAASQAVGGYDVAPPSGSWRTVEDRIALAQRRVDAGRVKAARSAARLAALRSPVPLPYSRPLRQRYGLRLSRLFHRDLPRRRWRGRRGYRLRRYRRTRRW